MLMFNTKGTQLVVSLVISTLADEISLKQSWITSQDTF